MSQFKDKPSGLVQVKGVARTEYRWIGFIILCGLLALASIGFTIRQADLGSIKEERENIAKARAEAITVILTAMQSDRDTIKAYIRERDKIWKDLYPEVKFPPIKFQDTSVIRQEIEWKYLRKQLKEKK